MTILTLNKSPIASSMSSTLPHTSDDSAVNASLLKRLADQYHDPLIAFFNKRAQSHWDAEELTQEVFCKILKRDDLERRDNIEAYVYTIAWSVLRDKTRSDKVRRRSNHIAFDEEQVNSGTIPVEQVLDSRQQYLRLIKTLQQLSTKTRTIFLLNRYEGITYSEIANRYGITTSAVEKHMMKALTSIRENLRAAP